MPDKSQETYNRLFEVLKRLQTDLEPELLMIDLEIGVHNAFLEAFEEASATFCYFHFRQALYRNLGHHNLKKEYHENEIFLP